MTFKEKVEFYTEVSAWDYLGLKRDICMTIYATLRLKPYKLHEVFYVE